MWIVKKSIMFLKTFNRQFCNNTLHKSKKSFIFRILWQFSFRYLFCINFRVFSLKISDLVVEKIGQITTIGLNNPSKKNCLNIAMIEELQLAFNKFDESESKVAILHGESGNFCSGFDIDEVLKFGHEKLENLVVSKHTLQIVRFNISFLSYFSSKEHLEKWSTFEKNCYMCYERICCGRRF